MGRIQNNIDRIKLRVPIRTDTWSLRKKFLVNMVMLLLLLGLTIALITRGVLLKVLKTEFQQKGVSLSRSLAANSVVDILTQNTSRLKSLVENEKKLDNDIAYIFIMDSSGSILTHTFDKGFPVGLLKANGLKQKKFVNIQLLRTKLGFIYDIAAPVFLENSILGQVRAGFLQNNIQRTISLINLVIISATLFLILIGIFLAYRISSLITSPISKLVAATQSIERGDFSVKIDIKAKGEIGILASAFNRMASRLNDMINQIKRLTTIEERSRISLDLHDGCAQDLANIIKRLELCERLFSAEPAKALKELGTLRENTRDVLNRTRQVIFDLKSPEQTLDFSLCNSLRDYSKAFQEQNGINVRLQILDTVNGFLADKSKSIFFMITEAFANIRKHSLAKNVEVSLSTKNNNLIINIRDDGKGFDINEAELADSGYGRWGLKGMRQRAASLGGTFTIKSMPSKGTELYVTIPLSKG